jgi:exopolyphosphatase/guanosine-5'-triphosphate,3'-diphosphate pyrophosphatase
MRLAAIDIGSNSIHMVVVEASMSGAIRVVERAREMIRLGASSASTRRLSALATHRAIGVLARYKSLAESRGAETILAVATSAVRESVNGEEFIGRVRLATGLTPRVLPGEEEARLVNLAARHSIHLGGRRAIVVDVGGGSVELALGTGRGVEWVVSEKLGVLGLQEQFQKSDPLSRRDARRMRSHIEHVLSRHAPRLRAARAERVIGTSGTALALGHLAHTLRHGRPPATLHHLQVETEALRGARRQLLESSRAERRDLPGVGPDRVDTIVPGAVLLEAILELAGAEALTLCEWALREGVVLDHLRCSRSAPAQSHAREDVRAHSVEELAERCGWHERHSRQVAHLALALYDATASLHGLGGREREWLEYAALLHDVGHHLSHKDHHKHSQYLILNGALRGFDPLEVEIIACVARYHRGALPRRKHPVFTDLPAGLRRRVRVLAGHLRLADALDRSHRQVVTGVEVERGTRSLVVGCDVAASPDLELWATRDGADLLETTLGIPIRVVARHGGSGLTSAPAPGFDVEALAAF